MSVKLRNTATGAIVGVSEEKAERLCRDGWTPADAPAPAPSTPPAAAESQTEESTPSTEESNGEEEFTGEEQSPAAGESQEESAPAPSKEWKPAELKAYADERGIDLGSARTKVEILDAINAAAATTGTE